MPARALILYTPAHRSAIVLGICAVLILIPVPSFGASFSTDFDGTGTGGVIEVDFHPSTSSVNVPIRMPNSYWTEFARYRYDEQQQQLAERRRQEEEELKRQEEIRRLQELQRTQSRQAMEALSALHQLKAKENGVQNHDYPLKYRIVQNLSAFESQRQQAVQDHRSILQRLSDEISKIQVPPPPIHHIPRVLLLGAGATPDDALRMQTNHEQDPFDGKPYSAVYGFAWPSSEAEFLRVTLDHWLLWGGVPIPEAQLERVKAQLKGATIGELVAHSNGAAVAEALIRVDVIHPKVLRILGGDGALMNLESLAALAKEKNVEIYVYATARDVVPLVPLGWDIRGMVDQLINAPKRWVLNGVDEHSYTYQVLGLRLPAWSSNLHVQLLSVPGTFPRSHFYETYAGLITGQRLIGCLDAACTGHR